MKRGHTILQCYEQLSLQCDEILSDNDEPESLKRSLSVESKENNSKGNDSNENDVNENKSNEDDSNETAEIVESEANNDLLKDTNDWDYSALQYDFFLVFTGPENAY